MHINILIYKYKHTHTCAYTYMCKTKIKDFLTCINIHLKLTTKGSDDKSHIRTMGKDKLVPTFLISERLLSKYLISQSSPPSLP